MTALIDDLDFPAVDFSAIRACATPDHPDHSHAFRVQAARLALAENPANLPHAALLDLASDGDPFAPSAVSLIGKSWEPGRVLGITYLNGTPTQRAKHQRWTEELAQYGNIGFKFGVANGEIRVAYVPGGSWSGIGADVLSFGGPTTQFGWVTDSSDDDSDRAVIQHEDLHFLSFGHEQSHPGMQIHWNKPLALAYFMQTQGWTARMVEDNVFAMYSAAEVLTTEWDPTSIMQYPVDRRLTLDGVGIGWNNRLSPPDKRHFARLYPGRVVVPPVAPPDKPPTPTTLTVGGPVVAGAISAPGEIDEFTLEVPAGVFRIDVRPAELALVLRAEDGARIDGKRGALGFRAGRTAGLVLNVAYPGGTQVGDYRLVCRPMGGARDVA
jgi:serralysin